MHTQKNKNFLVLNILIPMKTKITIAILLILYLFILPNSYCGTLNNAASSLIDTSIWVRNYPTISKGLTCVILKIRLTQPGKVYYVFYHDSISDITADKIKSDALEHTDTCILKYGTMNYPSVPGAVSLQVDGFDTEQQIYLYLVTESNTDGLKDSDLKYYHFSMHFKHRIVPSDSTTAPYGYLEYLPENYSKDSINGFPLVVFLHGSGGVGNGRYDGLTNPNTCMREGLTRYLELDMDLPAVVISPQATTGWAPKTLDTFIDYLKSHYNVNPDKITLTGISMGGQGTWQYAITYADKIAAAVPLCGAWDGYGIADYSLLAKLPVWAFHNDQDPTVNVNSTYHNIRGISEAGGHPFMSIFRSDDHSCAYEAYYYPHLWDWIFAQERGKGYVQTGLVNVIKSNQPLVIDGFFDEHAWNEDWNNIPYNLKDDSIADSKFKLLWDQNYLFTGISLNKEIYSSLEKEIGFYFNGNNDNLGVYDPYDFKFTFKSSDNSVTSANDTVGIIYKWAETDTSYNFEFAFPLSKTLYGSPILGDGFGLDIEINATDTETGLEKPLFWKGNIQDTSDTRLFGNVLLCSQTNDQITDIQTSNKDLNLKLNQNYPDPFSQYSTISYYITERDLVTLKVYDLLGNEIKTLIDQVQNEGDYTVQIDASNYGNGIYLYCLQSGKTFMSMKFAVIK
jgi:pimeloyl-ACP methyl ester carboxylesterase